MYTTTHTEIYRKLKCIFVGIRLYTIRIYRENNLKFVVARQAKDVCQYKSIKEKLHRTNAAIWHNKLCRQLQLTPNYIAIKVNGHNRQSRNTLKTAIKYRINQELKYLYIKKQKLNEQLYHLHLICAQNWQESWLYIEVKCTFVGIRLYSVHIFVKLTITRPKSYISRLYFAFLQLVDRDAEASSPTSN